MGLLSKNWGGVNDGHNSSRESNMSPTLYKFNLLSYTDPKFSKAGSTIPIEKVLFGGGGGVYAPRDIHVLFVISHFNMALARIPCQENAILWKEGEARAHSSPMENLFLMHVSLVIH